MTMLSPRPLPPIIDRPEANRPTRMRTLVTFRSQAAFTIDSIDQETRP